MKTIDVIIPTYKPNLNLGHIVSWLNNQTIQPRKIILMNTEQRYYEQLVYGNKVLGREQNLEIYHLSRKEFDHGGTRRRGVKYSEADYFVMMTQDALPADQRLLENLMKAIEQEDSIAVSYARQLPREGAGPIERLTRNFNYPEEPAVKGMEDLDTLGIKTYFCSNVCAMYRRDIYEKLGGFVKHTIFNEDMIYAATAVKAGYKIAYAADAKVFHSHDYSGSEQLKRNFDLAVSQADHPEIFAQVSSQSEGKKMVKQTIRLLKAEKYAMQIPKYIFQSGCKYIGYRLGLRYRKLPQWLIKALTMNPGYWQQKGIFGAADRIDATKGYGKSPDETK